MSIVFNCDLFELQCPECSAVVDAKPKNDPWLSKCHKCQSFLVIEPVIQKKPNAVLFNFMVSAVKTKQALKAVV